MDYQFQILPNAELQNIVPLVYELNNEKISLDVLQTRFKEMQQQNYECAVIKHNEVLIGVAGMWFCTRHYIGKSAELDHVYIQSEHRGSGLGKQFMAWIANYIKAKGYQSIELNTYVQNYPSHKFYYNEGFQILGYHFLKKI